MGSSRFVIASCLVIGVATGCRVYDPALLDSGSSGGMCTGRRPPARPAMPDDGTNMPDVWYGLRDVVLDQSGGDLWRSVGFNLDGYCTERPVLARECEPVDGTSIQVDGDEGIDNTFGNTLYPLVEASVPGLEDNARAFQLLGIGLPLLRMRNWNGTPNDSRIEVTITQAVVTVPPDADGTAPEIMLSSDFHALYTDGTEAPPPAWDGDDYTFARDETFLSSDPTMPLVYDNNAYVADNVVVMYLPDNAEILFAADNAGVIARITDGIALGTLSADGLRMDNVIVGGRWSVTNLLRTAEGIGLCEGTDQYDTLQTFLQTIVDVRSDPGSGGPGIECDAVSMGVAFTGYRLQFGGLLMGRPVVSLCDMPPPPDGGTQDAGMSDAGVDAGFDAGL